MQMAANLMMESSLEVKISGIEAGKREAIVAVWKFLDSYRERLVSQSQKFQHEKGLFESNREAALKEIHLDLQSKFQSKLESLVSKLNEALVLLQSRKQKIADQSKYINLLEYQLENGHNLTVTTQETNRSRSEPMQQNLTFKNDCEAAQLELQSLDEHPKNDNFFYENRISQLEADVIRLEQERDQLMIKVQSAHQPQSYLQTGMEVLLPVDLQIKERKANQIGFSGTIDDVHKQKNTPNSAGSEMEDSTPLADTPTLLDKGEEIVHVIKTSSAQFTMAFGTYNKTINSSSVLKLPQSAWVQAELLGTCSTNLHCLEAMLSYLKSGSENLGLMKPVQDLMKKWVLLDAKILHLQGGNV